MRIDLVLSTNESYRAAAALGRPYRSYAPLTLSLLAALVPEELDADVNLFDLAIDPPPRPGAADILAISSITCGAHYAYELADAARLAGSFVVIGGAHATALPEEAALHADAVVVGYGERSWPRLLRDFSRNAALRRYVDFSDPFAGEGAAEQRRRIVRGLRKGAPYFFESTTEASRGCPNDCDFCTNCSLHPRGVHARPVEDTLRELDGMGRQVLFLDSNFTEVFPPEHALWLALAERRASVYAAGSVKLARIPARVELAAERGLKGLLVGFESLSACSLASAGKGFADPATYAEAIRVFHGSGIKLLACFILGLDGDDPSVFERTAEFVERNHLDAVRYAIATPFPGTRLHARLRAEGRLIESDWESFDTEHVTFRPARMDAETLYEGHRSLYKRSYSFTSIFRRLSGAPPSLLTLMANAGFRNLALNFDRTHPRARE